MLSLKGINRDTMFNYHKYFFTLNSLFLLIYKLMSEFVPFCLYTVCFLFSLKVVVAKWLHAQLLIWTQSHFCCVLRRMLFSYSAPLHPGVSVGTSNSRSKPQCHFIYTVTEPKKISNSANCMSYSILMWRRLTFIIWVSIWLTLLFPGHIFCSWMAICKIL